MKDIYLVNYAVQGIKSLDQLVTLSFYKKTITKSIDTKEYNVKGIYGMNGSGKTGIISSVSILKNLLLNSEYLNNPIVQRHLDSIINKTTESLYIEVDFIVGHEEMSYYYKYNVVLSRDVSGKYVISKEALLYKKATSKKDDMQIIYEVENGEIIEIVGDDEDKLNELIRTKTMNLLQYNTMCSLFFEKVAAALDKTNRPNGVDLLIGLIYLFVFGYKLQVYVDNEDEHWDYLTREMAERNGSLEKRTPDIESMIDQDVKINSEPIAMIRSGKNVVLKKNYSKFESRVKKLYEFLYIFKKELKEIQIEKKEDRDYYACDLIMVYDSYKIHAEFESTGIKKLIKLFGFLMEMVRGGIVFIDEFDSNLHDVYLCALLEYLMENGEGQLCFTTHNVGPMDILKRNKKSIDFLTEDNTIRSWKTNGNYSPSKLYREGMIQGAPFNVDSIDFIGVFNLEGDM